MTMKHADLLTGTTVINDNTKELATIQRVQFTVTCQIISGPDAPRLITIPRDEMLTYWSLAGQSSP